MTCQDCVHYEVCEVTYPDLDLPFVNLEKCRLFKDKSKFIELPCEVGDMVWFIKFAFSYAKRPIPAMICGMKTFSNNGAFTFMALTVENNINRNFTNYDIGRTVFLTKEEAEQALKEREENGSQAD